MKKWLLVLAMFISGCSVVGPGERGVRVVLGSVGEAPLQPGPHLWFPVLFGIADMDVQIQKSEISSMAASRDMQDVQTDVVVNWSLAPGNVVKTYKEIGDDYEVEKKILEPAVAEVMKASTAKYTAEEVLTKRMEMKKDIDEGLRQRLASHGITLDPNGVSITNLKFSDEFTQAIERKQVAEQAALQAKYEAQKAAQDAQAAINRAKGQAESQRLVRVTLTPEILQQQAIEKWDGKFPQVMGSTALPFLNMKLK